MRRTCCSSTAGSLSLPLMARSSSASSGMLLHRKNDSREASSRSLMGYARSNASFGSVRLRRTVSGSRSMRNRNAGLVSIARNAISMPVLEAPLGATLLVEAEQRLHFVARRQAADRRAAPAPSGWFSRTRFRSAGRRPAGEDAPAARRIAEARRVEWPRHRDAVHRRLCSRRAIAVEACVIRLPLGFDERGGPLEKRDLQSRADRR